MFWSNPFTQHICWLDLLFIFLRHVALASLWYIVLLRWSCPFVLWLEENLFYDFLTLLFLLSPKHKVFVLTFIRLSLFSHNVFNCFGFNAIQRCAAVVMMVLITCLKILCNRCHVGKLHVIHHAVFSLQLLSLIKFQNN